MALNKEKCLICFEPHSPNGEPPGTTRPMSTSSDMLKRAFDITMPLCFNEYGDFGICRKCWDVDFEELEELFKSLVAIEIKFKSHAMSLAKTAIKSIYESQSLNHNMDANAFDSIRYRLFQRWNLTYKRQWIKDEEISPHGPPEKESSGAEPPLDQLPLVKEVEPRPCNRQLELTKRRNLFKKVQSNTRGRDVNNRIEPPLEGLVKVPKDAQNHIPGFQNDTSNGDFPKIIRVESTGAKGSNIQIQGPSKIGGQELEPGEIPRFMKVDEESLEDKEQDIKINGYCEPSQIEDADSDLELLEGFEPAIEVPQNSKIARYWPRKRKRKSKKKLFTHVRNKIRKNQDSSGVSQARLNGSNANKGGKQVKIENNGPSNSESSKFKACHVVIQRGKLEVPKSEAVKTYNIRRRSTDKVYGRPLKK